MSTFTATVEVSDGRGGEASASQQITGLNDAPSVVAESLSGEAACVTQVVLGFSVTDDQSGGSCNVAQVTGRCTFKKTTCGSDGFTVTVTTTTGHSGGSCIIKGGSWTDPWGAKSSDDTRFDVQACP